MLVFLKDFSFPDCMLPNEFGLKAQDEPEKHLWPI